jgi:hypothetical protein
MEKANAANKLKSYEDELTEAKYEIIAKKSKYFVPSKESTEVVPKEEVLWGINDLVITLPNRTKMIVYPEPKKTFQQKANIVARQ